MSTVDQIAAATGLTNILNKQQSKQAGLLKELASGETQSSIAKALATPFETEGLTIPVVQKTIALAGNVLSTSQQALSSVAANLTQALATASRALSAPASERGVLAQNFNELIDQTKSFTDNATVNSLNLVGSNAKAMSVDTTTEGGQRQGAGCLRRRDQRLEQHGADPGLDQSDPDGAQSGQLDPVEIGCRPDGALGGVTGQSIERVGRQFLGGDACRGRCRCCGPEREEDDRPDRTGDLCRRGA
jgi:hypothetical protein